MVNFEITKTQKIKEVNNSMCHNYYYIAYGRIYNESKTKYRKFKFIEWVDIFDILEYYDTNYVTDEEIKNYIIDVIFGATCAHTDNIKSFDDEKGLKSFYSYCNETIENYNKIAKKY